MSKGYLPIVLALALAGAAGGAWAQTQREETPEQNVKASTQYQKLLCTNPGFRKTRIAKECGPLEGSQFYDSCVASFNCDKQPSDANFRKAPPSETVK